LLTERGIHLTSSSEKEIAKDIKEKLGYVATDFPAEIKKGGMTKALGVKSFSLSLSLSSFFLMFILPFIIEAAAEVKYTMPDGNILTVGSQR
jgi:hypothetical protein